MNVLRGYLEDEVNGASTRLHQFAIQNDVQLLLPLTIPRNVEIQLDRGIIAVPQGTSLTWQSVFNASDRQVFRPEDADRIFLESVSVVRPEWFGAKADGVTDCVAAIEAAIAATANGAASLKGARVVFQRGTYYCSRSLQIKKACHLVGAGVPGVAASGAQAATTIRVPINTTGIQVWSTDVGGSAQGAWSRLEHLAIEPSTQNAAWGVGPNSAGDGILILATCFLRDIRVNGFGRDGIRIDTRTTAQAQADGETLINSAWGGNANLCTIENARIINCRGAGLHTLGQDTHGCVFTRISCATNGAEGFLEETFLGINTYIGCDSDANGRWPELSGEGIPLPDYHVPTTAPSNKSTFLGCYIEGDPPRTYPSINALATVIGGNLAEINRGTGVTFTGDRRSRLRVGRVARGGVWANEIVMPDGDESFLRFSPSTDGATAATVTLRVTAGPAGATIANREKFTTDPATFTPYPGNDPDAPATIDFYANAAHTLGANEVKDITCTAGVGGAAGNRVEAGAVAVTTNVGLVSVTNLAAASGGANGPELAWALAYRNFADGYFGDTGASRDAVGCYVVRRASDTVDVFGWTGLSHPTLKEGQFMLLSPMADTDHWVTQHQAVSVGANTSVIYEFTGTAAFTRANFFAAHGAARSNYHPMPTLTSESADLRIARQWWDSVAGRFKVEVQNTGGSTQTGDLSVLFVSRADYK